MSLRCARSGGREDPILPFPPLRATLRTHRSPVNHLPRQKATRGRRRQFEIGSATRSEAGHRSPPSLPPTAGGMISQIAEPSPDVLAATYRRARTATPPRRTGRLRPADRQGRRPTAHRGARHARDRGRTVLAASKVRWLRATWTGDGLSHFSSRSEPRTLPWSPRHPSRATSVRGPPNQHHGVVPAPGTQRHCDDRERSAGWALREDAGLGERYRSLASASARTDRRPWSLGDRRGPTHRTHHRGGRRPTRVDVGADDLASLDDHPGVDAVPAV